MTPQEIFAILKECANVVIEKQDGRIHGFGAINMCPECRQMTQEHYCNVHYPRMAEKLESLPWTKVIKDPRNPQKDDYPTKAGEYITMMDCDEHQVCVNTFHDGYFVWMNRTHIKWWMPLPNIDQLNLQ